MAEALKEAYPDEGTRPQNVKDMIEKAERDAVKDVAKGLHSATKALSKAQKNACRESRSQAAAPTGFGPIVAKATGRSEKLHA